jgi:hypothetical protein
VKTDELAKYSVNDGNQTILYDQTAHQCDYTVDRRLSRSILRLTQPEINGQGSLILQRSFVFSCPIEKENVQVCNAVRIDTNE